MYPFISHEVALAREADQRRRAERDRRVTAVVSRPLGGCPVRDSPNSCGE